MRNGIESKYGFVTTYVHLASDIPVTVGDTIEKGQVIGYVEETGYREKPFLHYGVNLGT